MFQFIYIAVLMDLGYYKPLDMGYFHVHVSAYDVTTVTLKPPWEELPVSRTLQNETKSWRYELSADMRDSLLHSGYRITSSEPITVQVSFGKRQQVMEAAYTLLPVSTESPSQVFRLASYSKRSRNVRLAPVFLVATLGQPATIATHEAHVPGVNFAMEANTVREVVATSDVTGLKLTSTAPVAVYSGHQCANVPDMANYCDPLFQQVPPLSELGTEYFVGPVLGREASVGFTLRVVVDNPSTSVAFRQFPAGPLSLVPDPDQAHSGGACPSAVASSGMLLVDSRACYRRERYLELRSNDSRAAFRVTCSVPCMVVLYNHGGKLDKARSDPFMTVLRPLNSMAAVARFTTFTFGKDSTHWQHVNYVTVVAIGTSTANITMDGVLMVDEHNFEAIDMPGSDVIIISFPVRETGSHLIESHDHHAHLMVVLYGHGSTNPLFLGFTSFGMVVGHARSTVYEPQSDMTTEYASLTTIGSTIHTEQAYSSERVTDDSSSLRKGDPGHPSTRRPRDGNMVQRSEPSIEAVLERTPHFYDKVFMVVLVMVTTVVSLLAIVCVLMVLVMARRKKKKRVTQNPIYYSVSAISEDRLTQITDTSHMTSGSDVISHVTDASHMTSTLSCDVIPPPELRDEEQPYDDVTV